ncbi:hypothetical protein GCK72_019620 [Caenorhabditis remanei]|uniref:SPRY domain-containing protein n=1 Tax=Caenorhabditis remanei TaxID=31234 RepID=A0A6A5GEA1_CAERE|nr:hypothetical protein GCK72_019620 [Caenorhabditis remanei]KAF1753064.1 hypothetical protein GCK72_019620 [Caenorhabditis remanei]
MGYGNFCHHDSNHYETWKYPNDFNDWLAPSKIYCLLDMDEGTLSFAADSEYLGVAFKGFQGKHFIQLLDVYEVTVRPQ